MVAHYTFHGRSQSLRGIAARENGQMPWSQLPAAVRRGVTVKAAEALQISGEWHHAGIFAKEVCTYYPAQVAAFWESLEAGEFTVADVKQFHLLEVQQRELLQDIAYQQHGVALPDQVAALQGFEKLYAAVCEARAAAYKVADELNN